MTQVNLSDAVLDRQAVFDQLPPEWPTPLLQEIQQKVQCGAPKVVVLDDDPTGTQTVHNVQVLTEWTVASLAAELNQPASLFYILTNSRSLPLPKAQTLNEEIGWNLSRAVEETGQPIVVVSRSDSTLRGHFPGELQALAKALATDFDGWLLIPMFHEGGRYTIHDIHYVAVGDALVSAAQTEFARDKVFGYRSSNLKAWVEEKTGGQSPACQVASISLETIRRGGPDQVAEQLMQLQGGRVCIVNAVSYRDLEVFISGLLVAEASGKRFLYRTAASFVQVRAGLAPRPLVTPSELDLHSDTGGLVIVGSYISKTTAQMKALQALGGVVDIELDVRDLLNENYFHKVVQPAGELTNRSLQQGKDVMIYTSRSLVSGPDDRSSLQIGSRVSQAIVEIVQSLTVRPRCLIAKGGITSSDVATRGLSVRKARVLGQILPGVPVWRLGSESRFPGLAYIVFPGNVGGPQALAAVAGQLLAAGKG